MTSTDPARYGELAEAAWRWVLARVESSDGPRIPASVDVDSGRAQPTNDDYRDGMHEGIGGLAHVLAEVRRSRPWTDEEDALAQGIAERLVNRIPEMSDPSFFDGLSSILGALLALEAPGADAVVRRLDETATADGWPPAEQLPTEHYRRDRRFNDATLGTASVVLAAVWAQRHGVRGARHLAGRAADALLAEAEPTPLGLNWTMVSARFLRAPRPELPNWSHGLAGIAASLAVAGTELGRPELVEAARRGAEHLVSLGDRSDGGFTVPLAIPAPDPARADPLAYGWCHGPTGTSLLFLALARGGVLEVAEEPTSSWYARGRHSVRTSGIPDRLRPGFWDNDGRCCGTAGVGDAFLDAYARAGADADLAFAVRLGDALVERAIRTDGYAYWRFLEHRDEQPLRPPGVGWMQGAAGIAAYLFRLARVLERGRDAPAVPRMENWWALDEPAR
jgi:hypothetical protein